MICSKLRVRVAFGMPLIRRRFQLLKSQWNHLSRKSIHPCLSVHEKCLLSVKEAVYRAIYSKLLQVGNVESYGVVGLVMVIENAGANQSGGKHVVDEIA